MTQKKSQHELIDENLLESKEMFKIIFDNSPTAITVTDSNECIVAWNSMAEKMLGMDGQQLFNKPVKDLYSPEEWSRIRSLDIRKKGILSDINTFVIRADGTSLEINASISVLKNKAGKIIGSIGIMYDISKQKTVEKELINAKMAAEEANHAKSVFLAKMSHEVRTPMNAVIGMLDLTLDTPLTEEQKDNLVVAKDSAQNLLSLINDILDLSRAESGKILIEEMEIHVADIVKNVCKGLAVLARNKQIDLVWSIDPQIPRILKGDAVRLRQILINLVNNAVKFTHRGKVEVTVKMQSLTNSDCVVQFEVIDQGIGIPPKNLVTIFDVFTEAHNTTARRYGGTGLGLAICKKLVEMMRGQIVVESTEGKGSIFRFSIIFGYQAHTQVKLHENKTSSSSTVDIPEEIKNLRILLAEDNMINQRVASKILEKFGWQVTCVVNGQEVLDILNKQSFDAILMDDQMPVLDGVSATQVIRREEKQTGLHMPIIAMTANAMAGDRERYIQSGMDGYVSKPIDRSALYNEIVTLVTQRLKGE